MKILSIIAQKPSSTGSGVYLSELVRCFKNLGHEQEVICAVYENDIAELHDPEYNYIVFNTPELPIKIAGMSDVMPYESIKYSDLAKDEEALNLWKDTFKSKVIEVIESFKPDLIICHHLYLLTSIVVDVCKNISLVQKNEKHLLKSHFVDVVKSKSLMSPRIFGICHNTDLRQYQQTDLEREYIKKNIQKLDSIIFLSEEQLDRATELLDLDKRKAMVVGIGYNSDIFNNKKHVCELQQPLNKLLYVGKIAKKKGVLSLIKAINMLNDESIVLDIIGGVGDKEEYDEILNESRKSKSKINFIGPMSQIELAKEYNKHDIFILPSFSEGMPMVPLEAMACGCKVVISDLPGVKNFYNANVKNASIKYVELPKLSNVDDASYEELSAFEKRLADKIKDSIEDKNVYKPDLNNISWENIARKVLSIA